MAPTAKKGKVAAKSLPRKAQSRGRKRVAKEDDVPSEEEMEEEESPGLPSLPPVDGIMMDEDDGDDDAKPAAANLDVTGGDSTYDTDIHKAEEGEYSLVDPKSTHSRGGKASWNDMLYQLILFRTKNGDFDVTPNDPNNRALFNWIQTQRRHYELFMDDNSNSNNKTSSTNLNSDRIAVLNAIDFQWNIRGEISWQTNFDALLEYKREHGDVRVPRLYSKNLQLGEWVTDQRRLYKSKVEGKSNMLTDERKAQLDEIGFVWKVRDRADWNDRYEQLLEFKKENGHCIVPQHYPRNRSLGKWVAKQREQYRFFCEGRHSFLTEERIELLKSINFMWRIKGKNRDMNDAASATSRASPDNDDDAEEGRGEEEEEEDGDAIRKGASESNDAIPSVKGVPSAPVPHLPQLSTLSQQTNPVSYNAALHHQLLMQNQMVSMNAGRVGGIGGLSGVGVGANFGPGANFNLASALATVPNNFGNAFGSVASSMLAAMNHQQQQQQQHHHHHHGDNNHKQFTANV